MSKTELPPLYSEKASPSVPKNGLLKRYGFYALNLFIMFHLVAVCATPLSVTPSSEVAQELWLATSPYIQVLYQNNGFHFFAPNPEGCNTVSYTVHFADGTSEKGMFPHRGIFPRLLYHRHLMLSESLGAKDGPHREQMIRDFAYQVCKDHQAEKVDLSLVWHELATQERIIAGGSLFDEDLFQETPLGTFTWDELSDSSFMNSLATVNE